MPRITFIDFLLTYEPQWSYSNGVIDNGGSKPGVAEGIGRGGVAAPLFRQSSRSLGNVLICYFRQLTEKQFSLLNFLPFFTFDMC